MHHKKHGFKETHITHHKDGSATVRHMHENPQHDVTHAVADLDGIHDSLQDHLGTPNPGEAEANAGPMAALAPGGGAMPTAQGA